MLRDLFSEQGGRAKVVAGDQQGNIRVWDLTANACSCELVPEVGTAVRSLTVALDASLVVAANNAGEYAYSFICDIKSQILAFVKESEIVDQHNPKLFPRSALPLRTPEASALTQLMMTF